MFSKRFFRRFLNRLRGVPLVLACIGAYACSGEVTDPEPAPLSCERIGEDHGCASSGCWGTYSCNRDPSAEMGVTCESIAEDTFKCHW